MAERKLTPQDPRILMETGDGRRVNVNIYDTDRIDMLKGKGFSKVGDYRNPSSGADQVGVYNYTGSDKGLVDRVAKTIPDDYKTSMALPTMDAMDSILDGNKSNEELGIADLGKTQTTTSPIDDISRAQADIKIRNLESAFEKGNIAREEEERSAIEQKQRTDKAF